MDSLAKSHLLANGNMQMKRIHWQSENENQQMGMVSLAIWKLKSANENGFIGNMKMKVDGVGVVCQNMRIGQGHVGFRNNWWSLVRRS